jgi:hypothetical protein
MSVHPRWRVTSVRTDAIHELASSFSRIHQLPRLKTINLTFYPIYDSRCGPDEKRRVSLQAYILDALATSFGVRAPPTLTSLSLRNLHAWHLSPLDSPPFQTVLTNLRHLHLSLLFDAAPDPFTFFTRWSNFWGTLPRTILAPTQPTLTELTLHSDGWVGAWLGLSLAGLHFPHLCALSLRNLAFEPSTGIESFILRHAVTLARLELLSCQLSIPDGTHLFLFSSLAPIDQGEESSPGPGGWNRIWDCFGAELASLVELHVACPPNSKIPAWAIVAKKGNEADVAALERFRAIVATRSEGMRREP